MRAIKHGDEQTLFVAAVHMAMIVQEKTCVCRLNVNLEAFLARSNVIKKCMNKFDCLVNEMLYIQELKPTLNVQSDSLRAKVLK